MYDVVVVDAGPVGLYTALLIANEGLDVDLSYRFREKYSLFVQCQLMHSQNRDFRRGYDGFDRLLRAELTRSFW